MRKNKKMERFHDSVEERNRFRHRIEKPVRLPDSV